MWLLTCLVLVAVGVAHQPLIIGHRGAPSLCPENTIVSFSTALAAGVDGLETDLRITKDNVVVLMHDETVNRTTNGGNKRVRDMTFAEISALDAGSWFSPKFAGTRVPSFEELLRCLQNAPRVFIVLDIKERNAVSLLLLFFFVTLSDLLLQDRGITQQIAAVVKQFGMEQRVVASCWTDEDMLGMRAELNVTTMQLLGSYTGGDDPAAWVAQKRLLGYQSFSLLFTGLPDSIFDIARRNMMPLVVWTVDEPSDLARMQQLGAFAVITNVCKTAISLFEGASPQQYPVWVVAVATAIAFLAGACVAMLICQCKARRAKRHAFEMK